MRRTVPGLVALSLFVVFTPTAQADEGDSAAVVNKAIKAHYPKGQDPNKLGIRIKTKGTLHINGMDLDFTQEVAVQMPNKFKEVMELTVMNMTIPVKTVYNGKDGWIRANGTNVDVTKEILAEFKEAAYGMGLMQGLFLKDKSLKFSLVGEVKVKDKPAIGVTVSREGTKDVTLYFDKETGLLAKVEMRKRDLMSGQEVTEERFITEYQEVGGNKVAKKVEVQRDGKPLLEAEVLEFQMLEKVDDSEFVQPK